MHLIAHVEIHRVALKLIFYKRKRRVLFHETIYILYDQNVLHWIWYFIFIKPQGIPGTQ